MYLMSYRAFNFGLVIDSISTTVLLSKVVIEYEPCVNCPCNNFSFLSLLPVATQVIGSGTQVSGEIVTLLCISMGRPNTS